MFPRRKETESSGLTSGDKVFYLKVTDSKRSVGLLDTTVLRTKRTRQNTGPLSEVKRPGTRGTEIFLV